MRSESAKINVQLTNCVSKNQHGVPIKKTAVAMITIKTPPPTDEAIMTVRSSEEPEDCEDAAGVGAKLAGARVDAGVGAKVLFFT